MEQKKQSAEAIPYQPGGSPFLMMFFFLLLLLFLFDPTMRKGAGDFVGSIFYPLFGFNNQYPHLTIFCAGVVLVLITSTIRHIFIDWIKMAEMQSKMKAFGKKMRELQMTRNLEKMQRLSEKYRPEIMRMNAEMQSYQLKPMVLTMFVAIAIFMWLYKFVSEIPEGARAVSLPWEPKWWLDNRFFLPYWVALYSLLTIPVGQAYQRLLKYYSFKKRIEEEEATRHIRANQQFDVCSLALEKLEEDGIIYREGRKSLRKAEEMMKEKKYGEVISLCEEISSGIEKIKKEHFDAQTEIEVVEEIMKKENNLDLEGARHNLEEAKKDFERGEYSSALFYAKKAKRIVRELAKMRSEKDKLLNEVKAEFEAVKKEFPGLETKRIERCIAEAEKSRDRESIAEYVEQARREIKKAKDYLIDAEEMKSQIEEAFKKAEELSVAVEELEEMKREIDYHFKSKDYHTFLNRGEVLINKLKEKLEKREAILAEISHAELVVKNAMSFGADAERASQLLQEAKEAYHSDEVKKAEKLVKKAVKEAEEAKERAKRYT